MAFIATEQFFQSGYNGHSWAVKQSQEDQFYFELEDLAKLQVRDFKLEMMLALNTLGKKMGEIVILNDESVFAKFILKLVADDPHFKIFPMSSFSVSDPVWISNCAKKFGIQDSRSLWMLAASKQINAPVIWPRAYLRVLNASYSRILKQEFGAPYWVYIENEKTHCLAMAVKSYGLDVVENLLKISPTVFKAYFLQHKNLWERKNFPQPHNDQLEREYFADFCSLPDGQLYTEVPNPKFEIAPAQRFQQAAFPLKKFHEKYFNCPISCNLLEDIYV